MNQLEANYIAKLLEADIENLEDGLRSDKRSLEVLINDIREQETDLQISQALLDRLKIQEVNLQTRCC